MWTQCASPPFMAKTEGSVQIQVCASISGVGLRTLPPWWEAKVKDSRVVRKSESVVYPLAATLSAGCLWLWYRRDLVLSQRPCLISCFGIVIALPRLSPWPLSADLLAYSAALYTVRTQEIAIWRLILNTTKLHHEKLITELYLWYENTFFK